MCSWARLPTGCLKPVLLWSSHALAIKTFLSLWGQRAVDHADLIMVLPLPHSALFICRPQCPEHPFRMGLRTTWISLWLDGSWLQSWGRSSGSLVIARGSVLLPLRFPLVITQLILEKYRNLVCSACWRDGAPAFAGRVSGVSIPTQPQTPAKATKGRRTRGQFGGEKATGLHG